ncbi:hypothetical protein JHK82_047962 [Glycine max]|nr:hypothetical protein JHK82_047962 [Glycine max]
MISFYLYTDVVSIPKTNENFRLLYDTKSRFRLHSIRGDEAKFKLCKVRSVQFGQKGGRNRGRVGVIKNREKHKGSFETIHVQDATGHEFATCMGNVFTIGKGTKPWISLPKGKRIKLGLNSVNIRVPIDCSPKGKLVEMNTQCADADNGCGSCSCEDNAMNEPILNICMILHNYECYKHIGISN